MNEKNSQMAILIRVPIHSIRKINLVYRGLLIT